MKNMKKYMKNKKGFSLVEIVAAILILGLLSAGVMSGLGFSQRMTRANMEKNEKMAILQEVVDELAVRINQRDVYFVGAIPNEIDLPSIDFVDEKYEDILLTVKAKSFSNSDDSAMIDYDMVLYEINASLEYETQNGTESVNISRLAGVGLE